MRSAPPLPYRGWGEDTVIVLAEYFEEGRLPAVCVVTGAPATSNLRRRFSTAPGWVGCLFFVSWFALLIALAATHRSASGYLPACNAVARRVRRRHAIAVRLVLLAAAAWIVLIPVAVISALAPVANPLGLAFAGLGLGAIVSSAVDATLEAAALGIQGRVVEDGFGTRWVQLRGVHPAFSRALPARLGR